MEVLVLCSEFMEEKAVMTADESILVNCIVLCVYVHSNYNMNPYKILLERVLPIDTRILRFTPTTVKSLSVDGEERGGR